MIPNPAIIQAVEQLSYRVTVGDVATQAGCNVNSAQQKLLVLATAVGAHMQVADSGEIVYLFPQNLRAVLLNKFLRLRLQEWGENPVASIVLFDSHIFWGFITRKKG